MIRRIRRRSRGVWADFRHRVTMACATALLIVVLGTCGLVA